MEAFRGRGRKEEEGRGRGGKRGPGFEMSGVANATAGITNNVMGTEREELD